MERTVELKFEAEVTETNENILRFRRTDLGWGFTKRFFYENFGKLVTPHLNLLKFKPKQKISIRIRNIPATTAHFEEKRNKITIRAMMNEKFNTGFSLRLPPRSSYRFFTKAFSSEECAELTESTLLLENKNLYEVGDFIEIVIQRKSKN